MKIKFFLSFLALVLFALLAGGSFDGEVIGIYIVLLLVMLGIVAVVSMIFNTIQSNNKKKRNQMIREDEQKSTDFDRSVFIGDDRCKLYFDASKKKVMIMRVMTEGIKKEYVDDFEYPGKNLATYTSPAFYIYDPTRRKLLSGTYDDFDIIYQVTSLAENDNNKDVAVNNTILPRFRTLQTSHNPATAYATKKLYNILIDECHGLMAISESGKVKDIFNYINASSLPKKTGKKSTINTKCVGDYLFIMDDFFKVLVLVGPGTREIINYSDIIEVSYEENGNQLYTKSAGRTIGGAIVGGVLMGGAGAVVGGLSGGSKQNKEIKNMDIKILLRNTSETTCILHFKDSDRALKADSDLYETYAKNANQAKDILSIIIDKSKQASAPIAQPITTASTSSVADELAKLAKLKADGILTEEEFQAQKSKLLGM
ncbi:MAG: SHOCT domain-containing protein [Bacteroidales bacterium]|nr:SHOCT domain-containing protein [Bacteroidales bacterium]